MNSSRFLKPFSRHAKTSEQILTLENNHDLLLAKLAVHGATNDALDLNSVFLLNPSAVSVSALMTLIDFTLSNARRFYSSTGNPSDIEGLTERKQDVNINESCSEWKFVKYLPSNFRAKTL